MAIDFDIQQSDKIAGVYIITPTIAKDVRGNIWTAFLQSDIQALVGDTVAFKHDKFSLSRKNVLRGIHGDTKSWKLVTAVYGQIQQVVVDMRKDSPTYLQWQDFIIGHKNQRLILIPPQLGNAYCVLSDNTVYYYKLAYDGAYMDADEQFSVKWNDPKIAIKWRVKTPILSARDK